MAEPPHVKKFSRFLQSQDELGEPYTLNLKGNGTH
jgi:hypothetical protein